MHHRWPRLADGYFLSTFGRAMERPWRLANGALQMRKNPHSPGKGLLAYLPACFGRCIMAKIPDLPAHVRLQRAPGAAHPLDDGAGIVRPGNRFPQEPVAPPGGRRVRRLV